jgi:metal-responsive CopG/Arc/MetJ family transcriptional regulator
MANSKAISIRIPDELLEKIDRLAEEKYKSHKGTPNRSLVILDAIVAYFDTLSDTSDANRLKIVSDSVSIVEFKELRDSVKNLSDSVKQLENKILTLSDIDNPSINEDVKLKENEPEQNQLSIISVSDNVIENSQEIDDGLTPAQLDERMKKPSANVSNQRSRYRKTPEKFVQWSKKQDIESVAWEFREDSKLFYRVEPLA